MESGASTIAHQASKCLKTLERLVQKYKERDWTFNEYSSEDMPDALARFRTWVDNTGALQKGGSSLDYRLRHADVRDEVLRLLSQLLQALEERWFPTESVLSSLWTDSNSVPNCIGSSHRDDLDSFEPTTRHGIHGRFSQ